MRVRERRRLGFLTLIGVLALLLGSVAACSQEGSDVTGDSDIARSTSTESEETTSSSSSSTTTMPAPTATTAPRWPITPVKPLPASGSVPVLSKVATEDPVVFLTIDDGMVRDRRVVELIETFRIPVSVFVNEGPMRADPDFFLRMTAFGGSINSHTRSHPKLAGMSSSAQRSQICGMKDVIGEYAFAPGHLFRSPFGITNITTQTVASSCGINAVLFWHVALNDGRVQYQQGHELQRGDIVLAHFREDLYDNITALYWQAASQGLTIAPIEAYLPLPS